MFLPSDQLPTSPHEALADLPTERLEHEIVEVAGQLAATTCHWILLIAEFDRRKAYEGWGFDSCSNWVAWQCSIDGRSAREHVRVGRALVDLPEVRGCFGRGELSYSKVRAITRIATPETEGELVELARQTTAAQLDRVVREYGNAVSAAAAFNAHEARYLDHHWDDDGCLRISAKLPAELGAEFLRALEAAETFDETEAQADGGSAEPPREPRARRADALVAMANGFLGGGAPPKRSGERREVVVHVDAEMLAGDLGGRCEIEHGPPIAGETARRLSCDSSIVSMLDGPVGPLSVGRKRRSIPSSTRRALTARDGGCRFPGCSNRRFVEGHHIEHWARGGETSLENLVVLCTHHHRLVHEGGFEVRAGPGGDLRFHRPNGREVAPRRPSADGEVAAPRITTGGIRPLSRGEPMDTELAVWALSSRCSADTG